MKLFRQILLALFALLFVYSNQVAVQAEEVFQASAAGPVADAAKLPQTNAEIRQWYNDQVAVIPVLDQEWLKQNLSAEERARRAHEIRHDARLKAREFMPDKREVADLQNRDQEKYGNLDGPTFEYLVQKNRENGLEGDAVYEKIIGSANRTNETYNEKFGVKPVSMAP